jgi:MerR family transcriptional regulator/heat shock protein HspR
VSRPRHKSRKKDASLDETRGVFMISVAAELADMHPQTLRIYEARGLIEPQRSAKNTRLYSQADVEQLRRIQRLTTDEGLNLAGVETVLRMEQTVERMRAEMAGMQERAEAMQKRLLEELERARRSAGGELVPYGAYSPGLLPDEEGQEPTKIPIKRAAKRHSGTDG